MTENHSHLNLADSILRVRGIAQSRLGRFANLDRDVCRESYLFKNDHLCGIRFYLGSFKATWMLFAPEIEFFRGQNPIGSVGIEPTETRKAA